MKMNLITTLKTLASIPKIEDCLDDYGVSMRVFRKMINARNSDAQFIKSSEEVRQTIYDVIHWGREYKYIYQSDENTYLNYLGRHFNKNDSYEFVGEGEAKKLRIAAEKYSKAEMKAKKGHPELESWELNVLCEQ